MTHFELILCMVRGRGLTTPFFFLHMEIQLHLNHLLKRFFLPLNCFRTFGKVLLIVNLRVYIPTLNSIPLIYMVILVPVPSSLEFCCVVISFEISKCESTNFILAFQDCLAILGPLNFQMNFRIYLSFSAKEAAGILTGIALNL